MSRRERVRGWMPAILRVPRKIITSLFRTVPLDGRSRPAASSICKAQDDTNTSLRGVIPTVNTPNTSACSSPRTESSNTSSAQEIVLLHDTSPVLHDTSTVSYDVSTVSHDTSPISHDTSPVSSLPVHSNIDPVTHNEEYCLLLQLPMELHLMILDELREIDQVAILSLRLTCRQFRRRIPSAYFLPIPWDNWGRWRSVLIYQKMCDRERQNKVIDQHPQQLVCGSCKCRHEISMFSADQWNEEPEARGCIAARSEFQICPHVTFTHAEIKRSRDRIARKWVFRCYECAFLDFSRPVWTWPFQPPGRIHGMIGAYRKYEYELSRLGRETSITYDHIITIVRRDQEVSTTVTHALKTMDRRICPHVRTGDLIVAKLKPIHLVQSDSRCKEIEKSGIDWLVRLENLSTYMECPHAQCLTKFALYMDPLPDGWAVRLDVERRLLCLNLTDSAWLAQINQESSRESRWPLPELGMVRFYRCLVFLLPSRFPQFPQ